MKSHITNPWFFISICLGAPVILFSILKCYEHYIQRLPEYGNIQPAHMAGLTDQHGNAIDSGFKKGKIMVVDFFFTRCPSTCIKLTNNMQKINKALGSDTSVSLVSFTVDPGHDDAAALRSYVSKMHIDDAKWTFLTGDKSKVYTIARNDFKITAAGTGIDDFIHSERLIIVDGRSVIRGYYDGTENNSVDDILSDIKKCKNESSDFITGR